MIIRFFKALWDWLFAVHGYLSFKTYTGSIKQLHEIKMMKKVTGGSPLLRKCKVCNQQFWAMKKNPTCRRISCFLTYRIKGGIS